MDDNNDEEMSEEDVLALIAAATAKMGEPSTTTNSKDSEAGRAIAALEISIHHLQRSNVELEEFIKENGHDRDLRQAIGENITVIARRKAILEDLRKQSGITEPVADLPAAASDAEATSGGAPQAMAVDVDVTGADASGIYL